MTAPTIGRKVYFRPQAIDGSESPVFDATVVAVNDDGTVNLACHDNLGVPFAALNIPFRQDGDETPRGQYAHWMPYQVAQHAASAAQADSFYRQSVEIIDAVEANARVLTGVPTGVTEADVAADNAGKQRPDNPSPEAVAKLAAEGPVL